MTIVTLDDVAREQSPFIDALPDTAELRVHRTGDLEEPLTVFYLVRGTATNGKDYALLPGELQLPAGEASASLFIDPMDDDEREPVETVEVSLIPLEIAPGGEVRPGYYTVGIPETARATIVDDEVLPNHPPRVAIVSPPAGAVLLLSRAVEILAEARDPDGWVTAVEFFVDGQSIGVARGIPWSPDVSRPADAVNDPAWHPPHHFQIIWELPSPGPHRLTAIAEDNLGEKAESTPVEVHFLEIIEPTVVHVIASDPEGAEGPLDDTLAAIPDPARFTLVRSGPVGFPLTVYFEWGGTAVNGVDYRELPSRAVIPENSRGVEVVVHPIDDALPERTEEVTLSVIPPVCIEIFPPPPECYLVGAPAMARALIRDNDDPVDNLPPRVRLVAPQDGQVLRAPAEVRLTAVAWDEGGEVVAVEFFAGDRSLGVVTEPDPMPVPTDVGDVRDPSLLLPRYSLSWSEVPPGRYTLTALATDNQGASSFSAPARLWVVDASELPRVTVEATDPDAAEPGDPAQRPDILDTGRFTIHRSGPVERPLRVYYRLGGSALNGVDYEELRHQAFIPAGETTAQLEVRPLHDERVEGTEHVELRLLPVCCLTEPDGTAPTPYVVGEPASARVAIHDNDAHGNVSPRIKLVRPVEGEVFVDPREIELVAVAQDPDGWVPTVRFFVGDRLIGTSEIVFVREPDPGLPQTFSIIWSDVPPGRHELTARAMDDAGAETTSEVVRIAVRQSSILPVVTIEATDPRASEGGVLTVIDPAVFTVQRSGNLAEPLTVFYSIGGSAENGRDYQELPGVLEIPPESASATIVVWPLPDSFLEDVETVILKLEPPLCPAIFPPPPGCYMVGDPGWALAGLVDGPGSGNLPPRAEMVRPFPGAVYHAPASIALATQARDRDGYVTRVEWFANDRKIGEQSQHFIAPPPPGDLQVFEFNWREVPAGKYLLTARATDEQGAVSAWSEAVGVVVLPGGDVPVVTLFVEDPLASEHADADGSMDTATFRVRRSGPIDRPLIVFYDSRGTAENGVDYATLGGQVTIPSGSHWARLTIVPINDGVAEDPETVVLELMPSPMMGPIEPYRIGSPSLAAALILDAGQPSVPTERIRNWLHLQLPGEPGRAYRLEASGDLREWQALSEGWADESGMHHVETAPGDFPRRFYRLRPLAPEVLEQGTVSDRDW